MATLYFNGAVDTDWATLGNWWTSGAFTTQASALPTSSDSVVLSATCDTNSGSEPTVVNLTYSSGNLEGVAVTVTGNATFNDSSVNDGTVTGNATFNDNTQNAGNVTGNAVFNGNTTNYSAVTGNATFNVQGFNFGTIGGNATFNDDSRNLVSSEFNLIGTVTGNATFTASSYLGNPNIGAVGGTVTFSSASPVSFTMNAATGDWTADTTNWVFTTAGQNWTFNDSSVLGGYDFSNGSVVITGNATFNDSSTNQYGTVTGNATFELSSAAAQISGNYVGAYGSISFAYEKGINGSSILGVI
jgi:hypothetical protein